jgi:CheY-like chemotaxis protein
MAALEQQRPDLIVIDVNLADRNDGWALAELVMELTPRPPRIIFSTGAPQNIPPEVAELGTVMAKPYEPQRLLDAIHQEQDSPGLLARLRDAISTT